MYIKESLVNEMQLCEAKDCTGCFSCMNICPKSAISVECDKLGKTIPQINSELCVECGLCRKSCPMLNESTYRKPQKCFAAWTTDKNDRVNCASGGIATALSRVIIRNGGKVFGAAWTEDLNLHMDVAENEIGLEKFKGSKYVQSFVGDSYVKVKKQLNNGEKILYIGSPCQIDGLLHFLEKKYDNLYTVDFICHGVPPIKYLIEYINTILHNKHITDIKFRDENGFQLTAFDNNICIYKSRAYDDLYFETFLKGVTYRDNCYSCKYARPERVSDLTIGDFWGLDKNSLNQNYDGKISTILVNTEKGRLLLEECQVEIYKEERPLEEALRGNGQLNHPSGVHPDRVGFMKHYKDDFYSAIGKTSIGKRIRKDKRVNRVKSCVLYKTIKKIVKRRNK